MVVAMLMAAMVVEARETAAQPYIELDRLPKLIDIMAQGGMSVDATSPPNRKSWRNGT